MLKHSIFICLLISNFILGQSLSLEVLTSKNEYKFGEYIDAKIIVKNESSRTVEMTIPRVSSRRVIIHMISPSGEEYKDRGLILCDDSKIFLQAGEEHEQQIVLNDMTGDFISVAMRTYSFRPGVNKIFAEMLYNDQQIRSNLVPIKVLELNDTEKLRFEKFKNLMDKRAKEKSARTAVENELEAMFKESSEGYREMALHYLIAWLSSNPENNRRISMIQNIVFQQYPNSYKTIRLLYSKDLIKQRKEIAKKIITQTKNEFYLKFYKKILDEK